MDRLFSKITAGGLSAGIFLIWWPQHVHGDGLGQLVLRGLLWTLFAEFLILAIGPAEVRVEAWLRARFAPGRDLLRTRLDAVPRPARTGGAVALAFCGLGVPLMLLAGSPTQLVKDEPPKVVERVIVKRPVVERKVVVRRVVETAPLQSAGAAPSVPASRADQVRPERTSGKAATRAAKHKRSATKRSARKQTTQDETAVTTKPQTATTESAPDRGTTTPASATPPATTTAPPPDAAAPSPPQP